MFNDTLKNISVCACIWESVFMFLETSHKKSLISSYVHTNRLWK